MTDDESTQLAASSHCLNCSAPLQGQFCSECGQEAGPPLTELRASLAELVGDFASLDFRSVETLRRLLLKPGAVTRDMTSGQRARFTPPFRLYLVISAMAIALMTASGLINVQSAAQGMAPEQQAWLEAFFGVDLQAPGIAERFDARYRTLFPLLNLLTPLGLALALKVVMRKRLFHEHAIAGLHIATAQVLISTPLIGLGLFGPSLQLVLSLLVWVGIVAHIWLFLKRMYGGSLWARSRLFCVLVLAYLVIATVITAATLALVLLTL